MAMADRTTQHSIMGTETKSASAQGPQPDAAPVNALEAMLEDAAKGLIREKFLPLTRYALMDRLTHPNAWPHGAAPEARRFFRYLDFWRQQTYSRSLLELEQDYEPFSPDSDLLVTRKFTAQERQVMQKRLVGMVGQLLKQANYTRIDPKEIDVIMTKESHYGLDLHVDMSAFEEVLIFYRGAITRKESRRSKKRLYLQKEEFDLPIFQRMFLLFKLKPEEARVREVMAEKGCDEKEAQKLVRKLRSMLPAQIKPDFVYMKLFKNIPRTDLEMVFPNTKIKFRLFDKLKLGVTAGGGLGMGVVGTAGKIAVATNPIALAGAVVGLGGVALRQGMNFINQKNRYMVTMAQNLYFHAMADNRGVMTLLADRAAEEDIKEEMLLYAVLAKERVNIRDIHEIDLAIEQYLAHTFDIDVDFDVHDALERLMADGIVTTAADGTLIALPPNEAAIHVDKLWDSYLDHLPDPAAREGQEFEAEPDEQDAQAGGEPA
jgi:hypothetical protein